MALVLLLALFVLAGKIEATPLHAVLVEPRALAAGESLGHTPSFRCQLTQSPALGPPRMFVAQRVPDGTVVDYVDFDGNKVRRQQFSGLYVALLLRQGRAEEWGSEAMYRNLDRYDRIYAQMKEILSIEPLGEGLLTIAEADRGTAGLAISGRSQEVSHLVFEQELKLEKSDLLYEVIEHEMGHNFDRFSSIVFAPPDPAHSFTTFMQHYSKVYGREAQRDLENVTPFGPDEWLRFTTERALNPYLSAPDRSWRKCVQNIGCGAQGAIASQGGLILRIAEVYGPKAIKRFHPWLEGTIRTRQLSDRISSLAKSDLLIEALSFATQADLSCFVDSIQWEISGGLRSRLAVSLPPAEACRDRDADGYSQLLGDWDDSDPTVHPGAEEIQDGRDNDQNGIVDEVLLMETTPFSNRREDGLAVSLPIRVRGHVTGFTEPGGTTSEESDYFKFDVVETTTLTFRLQSLGSFKGFIAVWDSNSRQVGAQFADSKSLAILTVTLLPGNWLFSVHAREDGTGNYELAAGKIAPIEIEGPPAGSAVRQRDGSLRLAAPRVPESAQTASNPSVRFWVSRQGWVGSLQIHSQMKAAAVEPAIFWTPPDGVDLSKMEFSYQFLDDDIPIVAHSVPASAAGSARPQVAAVLNGASFAVGPVSPNAWVTLFGDGLADSRIEAEQTPLPNHLGGTRVTLSDSASTVHELPLLFVDPFQINLFVPADVAFGPATLTVHRGSGEFAAAVMVDPVSPGLFSINGTGQGPAAGFAARVLEDGTEVWSDLFDCSKDSACLTKPISLGETDQIFLVLFGTGIRGRSDLEAVEVKVGGLAVPVQYAGEQGTFLGLDQLNVGPLLSGSVAAGVLDVVVTVNGKSSNAVTIEVSMIARSSRVGNRREPF